MKTSSSSLRHLCLVLTWLLLVTPAVSVAADTLPDLGDPGAALLGPDQEYRLGRAWLRQLRRQVPILEDPLVQEYAEHLVYELASHSDLSSPDLALVIVNRREINAFAVPGGVIGLNAGLFLEGESEDEVAGVIAHELAHLSQKHFLRRYADSQRMNAAVLAAMLASIAVAIAGDPEAGMAGMAATQAAAIQRQLAYSRAHEREADREGMNTLQAAGMDPDAMPRFFERMMREQQFSGDPPEFLLTHPVTRERVADSRARARTLGQVSLNDSLYFQLISARITAGFFSEPDHAVRFFSGQFSGGASIKEQAAAYGLVMALLRDKQFERARHVMNAQRERFPNEQWYRLASAEIEIASDDHDRAVALLREQLQLMPGNYTVSVYLARALLGDQQPAGAIEVIEPMLRERPHDPVIWKLAADAYGRSQQLARAHRARGEILFLHGQEDKAIEQMRFAMDAATDNFALHAQLKARLREMEALSREEF